ncbi:putative DNA excision repair protein ERCC-1 [Blattamonas nauphoetae]|uniref:DNA excision repair protein ERCC-1 n=1 Tax=Blattamonas nauphoetae TaxID=2049346 RepID=A0ABQ9X9J2_9EUKA|nr:putative DNA excision repair protein ERCC-1 [Blattamonas nauphoetae]
MDYHLQHPTYISRRIAELDSAPTQTLPTPTSFQSHRQQSSSHHRTYQSRFLIVLADSKQKSNIQNALFYLNVLGVKQNITLILAWSEQQVASHLEMLCYLQSQNIQPFEGYASMSDVDRALDLLTSVPHITLSDAELLIQNFGSLAAIFSAPKAAFACIDGFGPTKVQSLALKELASNPDSNPDAGALVVAYIKRFMTADIPLAKEALRIAFTFAESESRASQMLQSNIFLVLFGVIRKHLKTDTPFIKLALRTIFPLLQTDDARTMFVKKDGIDIIKELMTYFVEKDSTVMDQIFVIIKQLARCESVRDDMIEKGMVESILIPYDFYYGKETDAITSIMSLLTIFAETDEGRIRVDISGGIQTMVDSIECYKNTDPKTVRHACLALRQMMSMEDTLHHVVGLNGLVSLVGVVDQFWKDDVSTTIAALTAITLAADLYKDQLIDLEILPKSISILETHGSNHALSQSIFSIITLIANDEQYLHLLDDERTIAALLNTFKLSYPRNISFTRVGTGLFALLTKDEECCRQLVKQGVISVLFDCIRIHQQNDDVALNVTTALLFIGEDASSFPHFIKLNAVQFLLHFCTLPPPPGSEDILYRQVHILENVTGIITHLIGTEQADQALLKNTPLFVALLAHSIDNQLDTIVERCGIIVSNLALSLTSSAPATPQTIQEKEIESENVEKEEKESVSETEENDEKEEEEKEEKDGKDDESSDEESDEDIKVKEYHSKSPQPLTAQHLVKLAESVLPMLVVVSQTNQNPLVLSSVATAICNFALLPTVCELKCASDATLSMTELARSSLQSHHPQTLSNPSFPAASPQPSPAPSISLRTNIDQAAFLPQNTFDPQAFENTINRTWGALRNLTSNRTLLKTFTDNGGIDLVIQALSHAIDHSPEPVPSLLGLAGNVIVEPANAKSFLSKSGALPLMGLLGGAFETKKDTLLLPCLVVIDALVNETKEGPKVFSELECLDVVMQIFDEHATRSDEDDLLFYSLHVADGLMDLDEKGEIFFKHNSVLTVHSLLKRVLSDPTDRLCSACASVLVKASLNEVLQGTVLKTKVLTTILNAITAIVDASERDSDEGEEAPQPPAVTRLANLLCSVVWNAAATHEGAGKLYQLGAVKTLTDLAKTEKDLDVLKLCFGVLGMLSVNPRSHQYFLKEGTVPVVCLLAQRFVEEKRIDALYFCVSTLWNLSGNEANSSTIIDSDCIPILLSVLDVPLFVAEFSLMKSLIGCLSCLAFYPNTQIRIMEKGADRLLTPIRKHFSANPEDLKGKNKTDFGVAANGCCMIWNLAIDDDTRKAIGTAGGVKLVVDVLRGSVETKNGTVAEKAVGALMNLCVYKPNINLAATCHASTVLLSSFTTFTDDEAFLIAALDTLCILMQIRGNETDTAKGNGLDILLGMINTYNQNETIMLRATTIICTIAQDLKPTRIELIKKSAIQTFQTALKKATPSSTLASLLNKSMDLLVPKRQGSAPNVLKATPKSNASRTTLNRPVSTSKLPAPKVKH